MNSWILNSAESFSLKNCVLGNIGTLKGGKKRESKKSDIREEDSLKEMSVLLSPTGCLQRRHACCCHLWNVIAFLINFVLKSRSVVLSVSFFFILFNFSFAFIAEPWFSPCWTSVTDSCGLSKHRDGWESFGNCNDCMLKCLWNSQALNEVSFSQKMWLHLSQCPYGRYLPGSHSQFFPTPLEMNFAL